MANEGSDSVKVEEFLPRPSQYTGSAPPLGFSPELLQVLLKAGEKCKC